MIFTQHETCQLPGMVHFSDKKIERNLRNVGDYFIQQFQLIMEFFCVKIFEFNQLFTNKND